MNDEATTILSALGEWAGNAAKELESSRLYVFGSLVHRDGVQFNEESDIDLLIILPTSLADAVNRARWMTKAKAQLAILRANVAKIRPNQWAKQQTISVLAVTELEIDEQIHKTGSPEFYATNEFFDLLTGERSPIKGVAKYKIVDNQLAFECIRFIQKARNDYFGQDKEGKPSIQEHWPGQDPLPKEIMRGAAMARALNSTDPEVQARKFDVQEGLDFITSEVYQARKSDPQIEASHQKISVLRSARGPKTSLNVEDQLLLWELIFEIVLQKVKAPKSKGRSLNFEDLEISSVGLFDERFRQAFPGVRGIQYFDTSAEIKTRLETFFKDFRNPENSRPFWWWRGGNMHIENFHYLADEVFLLNEEEVKIVKIAAVNLGLPERKFLYLEASSLAPTGLYPDTPSVIDLVSKGQYYKSYYEEFYGQHEDGRLVSEAEFDDGAMVRNGSIENIRGKVQPRVRHVTPYNVVLAPHQSPFNNVDFDRELETIMDGMLQGRAQLEELVDKFGKLPKWRIG